MYNNYSRGGQPNIWNNRIRKAYWFILMMSFVCGLTAWPVIVRDGDAVLHEYIKTSIILQNGILLGIMVLAELVYRRKSKFQDYYNIVIGAGFSITYFSLIPATVYGVQVVMLLPILISTLYFSYRKVIFAGLLTLITYIILIDTLPAYDEGVPAEQIMMVVGSIMVCSLFVLGIVGRGLEIMKAEENLLVEEERLVKQKLSMGQLVHKDALTGLDNHRTFQEKFGAAIEQCRRDNSVLHLAIIDIDNFKQVNDSYGHWVGDIVLRRLGIIVGELSNEHVAAARYGGEEFAVIFTEMDSDLVKRWLDALYSRLEQTRFPEAGNLRITCSTGCHLFHTGENKEQVFKLADQALYQAKQDGKNRIVWSRGIL